MRRFLPLAVLASSLGLFWSMGCKDDEAPKPQVLFDSELKAGAAGTQKCRYGPPATFVQVGKYGAEQDGAASFDQVPVPSGENGVGISCRVAPDGDGFKVDAQVTVPGADVGGTVSIQGRFTPGGTQTNVRAVFQKGSAGVFEQADCTAVYDPTPLCGEARQPCMGVAAGRVWARLDCPKMVFTSQERECAGTAVFRFENCSQ